MELNFLAFAVAAIVPLFTGFLWYGPIFGKAWMNEMGFTKESMEGKNMGLIYFMCFVFSFILAMSLQSVVIHQMGIYQTLINEPGFADKSGEAYSIFQDFMTTYGDRFRNFGHGALHGGLLGLFTVLPVIAIKAMFEQKSIKYIALNAGYWIVTLAIMGGIVCAWK